MIRALSLCVAVSLGTPVALIAQGVPTLDSTRLTPVTGAGKHLVFWTAEEGAAGEQVVYLRNISTDRSITITSWEVYECFKVAGGICGKRDKGPTIQPGKTVRLVVIRGFRGTSEGYSFRYRFTQQWTDEVGARQ